MTLWGAVLSSASAEVEDSRQLKQKKSKSKERNPTDAAFFIEKPPIYVKSILTDFSDIHFFILANSAILFNERKRKNGFFFGCIVSRENLYTGYGFLWISLWISCGICCSYAQSERLCIKNVDKLRK